jgi:hypothetical protein
MRGLSEFLERQSTTSLLDSARQSFPPRLPGTSGAGWSSDSVPSGPAGVTYMTRSAARSANAVAMSGRASIVVSGRDVTGVSVSLRAAGSIRGRVVVEEDPRQKSARPTYIQIRAEPANGDPRLGLPRVEGPTTNPASDAFEIFGVRHGRYLLRANLPVPWVIKSVLVNGKDVTETPLDASDGQDFSDVVMTITNAAAVVGGVVADAQGQSAAAAAVLLFPANPAGWSDFGIWPRRIKTMSASNTGAFQFPAQPAGDYYVIALPRDDIDAWQAPDFFKQAAARATRITVGWGETRTVELRIVK